MDLLEHLWRRYQEAIRREVEQEYASSGIRVGQAIVELDVKDRVEKGGAFAFLSFAKRYLQPYDVTIAPKGK